MPTKQEYINKKIRNFYMNKYYDKNCIGRYEKKRTFHPINKIIDNMSRRTGQLLGDRRKKTHMELIGCTKEELKKHLENKFIFGMSYDNYGDWEVDHIKPIAAFDLDNETDVDACFNYTNLQPLWKEDNRKKNAKYDEPTE